MDRRGFMAALAALVAGRVGVKAAPPPAGLFIRLVGHDGDCDLPSVRVCELPDEAFAAGVREFHPRWVADRILTLAPNRVRVTDSAGKTFLLLDITDPPGRLTMCDGDTLTVKVRIDFKKKEGFVA